MGAEVRMAETGNYPSHHVPDEGIAYLPGERVRVDHSSGQVRIVKDDEGDHEVLTSRPAPEVHADRPVLRINLRRLRP